MTELHDLKEALRRESEQNIFNYWLKMIDHEQGGFHCLSDFEGTIQPNSPKAVLLHSRILWSFSAAYRVLGNVEYLDAARHCFQFLVDKALDKEHGGVYWMLNHQGEVTDSQKHVYNQGFAIYAFSEYFLATGDNQALELAKQLFDLIETHSFDREFGGYIEAFDREWNQIPNHLVCDTSEGVLAEKSMNTHLHIMEAYTTLHKAAPCAHVQEQLEGLVELTRDKIINPKLHFDLFFTRDWQCVSQDVSYGHDIEGTWLIDEAAAQLTDREFANQIFSLTTEMAQVTLDKGRDANGAVFNELRHNHLLDADRIWWVQAEAMIGFFNAFQKEPKPEFFEAALQCWHVIETTLVDENNGEWHWKTDRNGTPYSSKAKVEPWKCPYHNGRACLEIYSRIAPIESTQQPTLQ